MYQPTDQLHSPTFLNQEAHGLAVCLLKLSTVFILKNLQDRHHSISGRCQGSPADGADCKEHRQILS